MSPTECAAWFVGTWLAIAAAWAIARTAAWARRHLTAADQWIHDAIDDELADWLATWEADYRAETDYNPQAGLQRLRDAIEQAEEET